MESNLADVEQRIKRYWYTDGIGELVGGGIFILMGVYFALQQYLGEASTLGGILQASLVLIMIGGVVMGRRLINALKARLTYPRTGYVEYRVNERGRKWRGILAAGLGLVIAALAVVFVRLFQFFDSTVGLTGIIVAGILVIMQSKSAGLIRFYLLGAISVAIGLLLSVSGFPEGYSLGLFYGLMGLCLMMSGGVTLRSYLQENPLPVDAEHHNG